jgi:hypothetical protein
MAALHGLQMHGRLPCISTGRPFAASPLAAQGIVLRTRIPLKQDVKKGGSIQYGHYVCHTLLIYGGS